MSNKIEQIEATCKAHNFLFESYCETCMKDLCKSCLILHKDHSHIKYKDCYPDDNELKEAFDKSNSLRENYNKVKFIMYKWINIVQENFNAFNNTILRRLEQVEEIKKYYNKNKNKVNFKFLNQIHSIKPLMDNYLGLLTIFNEKIKNVSELNNFAQALQCSNQILECLLFFLDSEKNNYQILKEYNVKNFLISKGIIPNKGQPNSELERGMGADEKDEYSGFLIAKNEPQINNSNDKKKINLFGFFDESKKPDTKATSSKNVLASQFVDDFCVLEEIKELYKDAKEIDYDTFVGICPKIEKFKANKSIEIPDVNSFLFIKSKKVLLYVSNNILNLYDFKAQKTVSTLFKLGGKDYDKNSQYQLVNLSNNDDLFAAYSMFTVNLFKVIDGKIQLIQNIQRDLIKGQTCNFRNVIYLSDGSFIILCDFVWNTMKPKLIIMSYNIKNKTYVKSKDIDSNIKTMLQLNEYLCICAEENYIFLYDICNLSLVTKKQEVKYVKKFMKMSPKFVAIAHKYYLSIYDLEASQIVYTYDFSPNIFTTMFLMQENIILIGIYVEKKEGKLLQLKYEPDNNINNDEAEEEESKQMVLQQGKITLMSERLLDKSDVRRGENEYNSKINNISLYNNECLLVKVNDTIKLWV